MKPVDLVRERLLGAKAKRNGGWIAPCPAHDDSVNSLSVDEGDDGRALLKCFAGCETETIVAKLGLTMQDLFPHRNGEGGDHHPENHKRSSAAKQNRRPRQELHSEPPVAQVGSALVEHPSSGCTLAQYIKAKRLPEAFLQGLGLSDSSFLDVPAIRIAYFNVDGAEAAVRFRIALEGDRFRWKPKAKPCLYGLWRLGEARKARYAVLVEGESDCHTAWLHEIQAFGIPGADSWSEERDAQHFDEIPTIYQVIEPDQGGETVKRWLATSRIRDRVRLVDLGEYKDLSGLYLADLERFRERWQAAIEAAIPWAEYEVAARQQQAAASYAQAKELLEAPDLLCRIGAVMRQRGYAGDLRPPLLGYVAMTSRLLERPSNLAYIAQSAAGKNRAVDAALELMPEDAYYLEKAGSARALIYTDEAFEHRVVVVSEADSIPEDGPAASAIRSIAEDNAMAYDVVEKDAKTGRFATRHIVKPGPTALITTSTTSLGPQMGTRMLEIPIPDDAEQTRSVLKAHARAVSSATHNEIDLTPFLALQRYLAAQGEQRVIVPFADTLADLMPAQTVRMRRDFRQLLTYVQTIALLYQCRRERTPDGAIIASFEDYVQARELLAPIFDSIVADGLTPATRQTVEAIQEGEEVNETTLAERLGLSKTPVRYRVNRALKGGWLINDETRKGYPAKLRRSIPLPDVRHVLPTVDDVEQANRAIAHQAIAQDVAHHVSLAPVSKNAEVRYCATTSGDDDVHPPPSEMVEHHAEMEMDLDLADLSEEVSEASDATTDVSKGMKRPDQAERTPYCYSCMSEIMEWDEAAGKWVCCACHPVPGRRN